MRRSRAVLRAILRCQVLAISLWHPTVPAAAVPKATVNEDSEPGAPKDEVGPAWEALVTTPAGDSLGTEDGRELQLGGFVAARADGGHDLAAPCLCEYVGHFSRSGTSPASLVDSYHGWRQGASKTDHSNYSCQERLMVIPAGSRCFCQTLCRECGLLKQAAEKPTKVATKDARGK